MTTDHTTTDAEPLTRAEAALVVALGLACVERAGGIAAELRYLVVSDAQRAEIMRTIERVLTDTVLALRGPGPIVVPNEMSIVIHEVALCAVASVLGDPPATDRERAAN